MEKKRINYARSAGRGRDERPFSLRGEGESEGRRVEEGEGRGRRKRGEVEKIYLLTFSPPPTLKFMCFLLCVRYCLDSEDTVLSGQQSTSLEA